MTYSVGRRFALGDTDALTDAYRLWGGAVYRLAQRCLGEVPTERAGDGAVELLTERTFVGAWRNRHHFDPRRERLDSWLFDIARGELVDSLRNAR